MFKRFSWTVDLGKKKVADPLLKNTGTVPVFFKSSEIGKNSVARVLVRHEMYFCLIGVNRKWLTVANLF